MVTEQEVDQVIRVMRLVATPAMDLVAANIADLRVRAEQAEARERQARQAYDELNVRLVGVEAERDQYRGGVVSLVAGLADAEARVRELEADLKKWQTAAYYKVRTRHAILGQALAGDSVESLASDFRVPVEWVQAIAKPGFDWGYNHDVYAELDSAKADRDRLQRVIDGLRAELEDNFDAGDSENGPTPNEHMRMAATLDALLAKPLPSAAKKADADQA